MIYQKIFQKINQAENILLVGHRKPDPDTVSGVCAIADLLKNLNKNYTAYCYDEIPRQFYFLPHAHEIQNKIKFSQFDLIITFDCGNLDRTALTNEINNRDKSQFVINIDHHIKIDDFADLEIKDTKVCSVNEIIYTFFKKNNLKISKNIAECILTGILADSGNFLFPQTNEKNISISAEMLYYGANWPKIINSLERNKKLESLQIWGKALKKLKINTKYNFAFTLLTQHDIKNIENEELAGLPELLSTLSDVKGVMTLKEEENGNIHGNIRSSCPKTDVSILANALSGGGNSKTSGFIIEGNIIQKNNQYKIN